MDFRKQTINGKLYNVVNYNDFNNNRELYDELIKDAERCEDHVRSIIEDYNEENGNQ